MAVHSRSIGLGDDESILEHTARPERVCHYSRIAVIASFPSSPAVQGLAGFLDVSNVPGVITPGLFHPYIINISDCRDIIRAMNAFTIFADEAREQNRSTSDALKYACQNWTDHLLRARNPWDDKLGHKFQTFWNRHLLSWLERQWCLKGLRSCLAILSQGQELAKIDVVHS